MSDRRFTFPGDISLIIGVIKKVLYYSYQRDRKSPRDLIALVKARAGHMQPDCYPKDLEQLEKTRRAVNFFLIRMLKSRRPCLIRSCILYEQALKNKLNAELIIGAKYENGCLKGHSWITIDNQPFREVPATLQEYTIMMKS